MVPNSIKKKKKTPTKLCVILQDAQILHVIVTQMNCKRLQSCAVHSHLEGVKFYSRSLKGELNEEGGGGGGRDTNFSFMLSIIPGVR